MSGSWKTHPRGREGRCVSGQHAISISAGGAPLWTSGEQAVPRWNAVYFYDFSTPKEATKGQHLAALGEERGFRPSRGLRGVSNTDSRSSYLTAQGTWLHPLFPGQQRDRLGSRCLTDNKSQQPDLLWSPRVGSHKSRAKRQVPSVWTPEPQGLELGEPECGRESRTTPNLGRSVAEP